KKRGQAPHLVCFLSPTQEYSADRFRKEALLLIRRILEKKKNPLLIGGTGLYLRALFDGLFEPEGGKPVNDESLREKLLSEQAERGGNYLHEKLEAVDPASAVKIHPHDLRRTVRALEVFHLTGRPFSAQKANRRGIREELPHRIFLIEPERAELYERINRRVERMFKEGLVAEVKDLLRKKLSRTAQMALGVREVREYLEGRLMLEEAKALLKKNTRNYAKRQLSWFRHERGVEVIPVAPGETHVQIAGKIRRLLRNDG
ncbi:MAG: tRNA (adenosine(37)-N6)-dimethylallyltransferase MiaA, partial [Candidatus Omnitrophota bacterium]